MTEEEAKTKWCPAAKISLGSLCIGSACMAWRWVPGEDAMPNDWRGALGYCGLAGKP